MQEGDEPCDFTIHVKNESFRVHRAILSAAIPYFEGLFRSGMKETSEEELTLKGRDVDPAIMKCMIDYAYTNKLQISSDNVLSLLKEALYMNAEFVTNECFKFLRRRINSTNVLLIQKYAEIAQNAVMIEETNQYVKGNFEHVSKYEQFLHLDHDVLKEIIEKDDLFVMTEAVVFKAVMRWVKYEQATRATHLPELLRRVRMHLLSPKFLDKRVSNERLIMLSDLCKEIVSEVRTYHSSPGRVSSILPMKERYCEQKYHFKCAKITGVGMYCTYYHREKDQVLVNYCDPVNKTWHILRSREKNAYFGLPDYIICTQKNIYFITSIFYNILTRLCLKTLKLTTKHRIDPCPIDAGVALVQDVVYFFGDDLYSSYILCFNLQTHKCTLIGEMEIGRRCPAATHSAGRIYVTGGCQKKLALSCAERYDVVTQQSSRISSMLVSRFCHSCTVVDGKIYVYGGYNFFSRKTLSQAEVYDPESDCWSLINLPMCLNSRISLVHYVTLCAVGTRNDSTIFIENFESDKNEWELWISEVYDSKSLIFLAATVTNSASVLMNDIPFDLTLDISPDLDDNGDDMLGNDISYLWSI